MPPPARVCKACKASKVRCDFSPGESCSRCTRLGLLCEAAPQIPRVIAQYSTPHGDGNREKRQREENVCVVAPALVPAPADIEFSTRTDAAAMIWREVSSSAEAESELFCLKHMASIAQHRNAYSLMQAVVSSCRAKSYSLAEVLRPWKGADVDTVGSLHPLEILERVSTSRGYCTARTISPSGRNSFFGNASFEHDVASLDALNQCYEQNLHDVDLLYLHPDDQRCVDMIKGRVFTRACSQSGELVSIESDQAVRVLLRHTGSYADCKLRLSIMVRRETGFVSGCMEFFPTVSEATPATTISATSAAHAPLPSGSGTRLDHELIPSDPTSCGQQNDRLQIVDETSLDLDTLSPIDMAILCEACEDVEPTLHSVVFECEHEP